MTLWNRIEQAFKHRYLRFLERLFSRDVLIPQFINFSRVRRILVVRQHDQLGDFLLATPVLRALREHFPQAHIGVVVRSYFAEVVQHHPHVDEVLVVQEMLSRWTPTSLWRFWKQLRRGWDLAIVLNTVSHSLTSDLIAVLSRAPWILGSEHRVFPGCRRNFFYNLLAPYWDGVRHQTERNLDIVRHIEVDTEDRTECMQLTPEELAWADQHLADVGVDRQRPIVGMHIGAGKVLNRWPVRCFAELAGLLRSRYQAQVLVFWGPGEAELKESFLQQVSFAPALLPPMPLRRLAACFRRCDALLCNDTGVMHLAAAVKVPTVAVFGPTDPAEWKPLGDHVVAVRGEGDRTDTVTVQQVHAALLRLCGDRLHTAASARLDITEDAIEAYVASLERGKR